MKNNIIYFLQIELTLILSLSDNFVLVSNAKKILQRQKWTLKSNPFATGKGVAKKLYNIIF